MLRVWAKLYDAPGTLANMRRRRWLRYGEPWGLLAKTNSKATRRSVITHAFLAGVIFPAIYGVLMWAGLVRDFWTGHDKKIQAVLLLGFVVFSAFIGGLSEWQVEVDDIGPGDRASNDEEGDRSS